MDIWIINGPNLNLLGKREKSVYGDASFESYLEELRSRYPLHTIHYYQSNVEGELINKIHECGFSPVGIVIPIRPLLFPMLSGLFPLRWSRYIFPIFTPENRIVMFR